jgi:hypothetical protein
MKTIKFEKEKRVLYLFMWRGNINTSENNYLKSKFRKYKRWGVYIYHVILLAESEENCCFNNSKSSQQRVI